MAGALGEELRSVRHVRGLSLKAVSEPAGISAAYLQKLEQGDVRGPSPHVLYRLAEVLELPYGTLMELAGYVVPTSESRSKATTLDHALSSSDLDAQERKAVAAFIAHLREQRN